MVTISGSEVGPLGFGLMGFTWRPDPVPAERAISVMKRAVEKGAVIWNGGEFYGTPEYNSLHLIRKYFEKHPEDKAKVRFSIKGALDKDLKPVVDDAGIQKSIQNCQDILGSDIKLDIFQPARLDPDLGIEPTIQALKNAYDAGQIKGVSLSEVSGRTVEAARKILGSALVTAEVELSMFSPDPLSNGVGEACRKYGIPLTAYSPLGRGFLTGRFKTFDDLPPLLKTLPRYQGENFDTNIRIVDAVQKQAAKKGCTPAQLAIGWLVASSGRGSNPVILPIPGASAEARVDENFTVVKLSDEEVKEIDDLIKRLPTQGGRYDESVSKYLSV